MVSRYSKRLGPSYQGHTSLDTLSFKLWPLYAETGMKKRSVFGLKPFPFKNTLSRLTHSSYLVLASSSNRVPFFAPFDSRIVHLVYDDNQFIDSIHLCKNGMFTGLTTFIESSFKFALSRTDN